MSYRFSTRPVFLHFLRWRNVLEKACRRTRDPSISSRTAWCSACRSGDANRVVTVSRVEFGALNLKTGPWEAEMQWHFLSRHFSHGGKCLLA